MYITDVINDLTNSKKKLQQLKQEFEYVKPKDQHVLTIERLLIHIEQVIDVCANSPYLISPGLIDADRAYFKLNVEGLEKILDAIR